MRLATYWDVICGAAGGPVVLGVDFPVVHRREGNFSELAARLGPGCEFLQTRPRAVRSGQRPVAKAYVSPWIEDIAAGGRRVDAILGYRIGGVYAAAIAEGIAEFQPMPQVILFDPQFADSGYLGAEFHKELRNISPLLSDEEIERASKAFTEILASAHSRLTETAAELAGLYWEVSSAAYERVGLGSAYDDMLIAPFDSYISWLSVAAQIDPCPVWKRSTAVVSTGYPQLRAPECQVGGIGFPFGRSIPVDVAGTDLLRSDSAARAIRALLRPESEEQVCARTAPTAGARP
jgi:hypothetical protein